MKVRTLFLIAVLLTTFPPAFASSPEEFWTAAVCTATLVGQREHDSNHRSYEQGIADFRRSLRAFAPDIRGEEPREFKVGKLLRVNLDLDNPPAESVYYRGESPAGPEDSLAMAVRTYGIEHDVNFSDNTTFQYGYVVEGKQAIRAHLEGVRRTIEDQGREIEAYLGRKLPVWRPANLLVGAFTGLFAAGMATGNPHALIDLIPMIALGQSEFQYFRSKLSGEARRTHQLKYAPHLDFMIETVSRERLSPDARAIFGRNVKLSPYLIEALKMSERDDVALATGIEAQSWMDRASWWENFISNLRHEELVWLPRGPVAEAALDDMLFVDPQSGEPVYVFSVRFLKDRPSYPRKPRETQEWFSEFESRELGQGA